VYHCGYDVRELVEVRITHDELVVLHQSGSRGADADTSRGAGSGQVCYGESRRANNRTG